jgi:hypothetical protein
MNFDSRLAAVMVKKILKIILPNKIRYRIRRLMNAPSIAVEKAAFNYKMRKAIPVFIYQMGKVGSISIKNALAKAYPGKVIHGHRFFIDHPDWRTRRLYNWVLDNKGLKIISPIRNPIDRNISFFFQNLNKYTGSSNEGSDLTTSKLIKIFLSKFDHDSPNRFYESDMMNNFSINVYGSAFPDHGYKIYRGNNISLLVIKSELSNRIKSSVIKEFLDLTHLDLKHENISQSKLYGSNYEKFKQELRIPSKLLDLICHSKYFSHFYSDISIERVRDRWQKRSNG